MTKTEEKIAFVVDPDGEQISAHFGRAEKYLIVSLEDGQEVGREERAKHTAHGQGQSRSHQPGHRGRRHQRMIEPIQDCQILIARGMGGGAFSHLQEAGIQALLTEHEDVASALRAYQAGELEHRPERLHARGGGHGHEGEH